MAEESEKKAPNSSSSGSNVSSNVKKSEMYSSRLLSCNVCLKDFSSMDELAQHAKSQEHQNVFEELKQKVLIPHKLIKQE